MRSQSAWGFWLHLSVMVVVATATDRIVMAMETGELARFAEIRVIDGETGRGVPLVELETVNHLRFVTDNAGRVAFLEPGLMDREIFFTVKSHGYDVPKDGFGIAGVKVTPRAGKVAEIKIRRVNIAERLCRLTGEGLYRDSVLLGQKTPLADPLNPGRVAGQDSIQAAIYRGRVYHFWGDTSRMNYPLGLFRMAGAKTPIPDGSTDWSGGIPYEYFTDKTGFARAMMPLKERPEGVVWVEPVFVVPDDNGVSRLVGHYSRRKGLAEELEHGIAVFNDATNIFEPVKQLPLTEKWRHPNGPPVLCTEDETEWLLFGSPSPNVRVKARLESVLDPSQYEALVLGAIPKLGRRWSREGPPIDSPGERAAIKSGALRPADAAFLPEGPNGERITLHRGSVRWNNHRKRWILIAGQIGGTASHLGEIWYSEADHPTGPFSKAVKIVTHDRQTFYNPVHHPFLDRGQFIHFEGTYTNDFSGNPHRTPRYNYNQVLYRLDLDAPGLRLVHGKE